MERTRKSSEGFENERGSKRTSERSRSKKDSRLSANNGKDAGISEEDEVLEETEPDEPPYSMDFSRIAKCSQDGSVTWNFLEFYHSYAYDCRRYFNLCVASSKVILFASGNLITFFDVDNKTVRFKRGLSSKGIGHICKNQVFNHIAIGENGENPLIRIYQWPSLERVTVLRNGTTRRYFNLAYSPDGLLLASQGGAPDYYITIWKWQESKIALRCKSFVQDVYNITFAQSVPGCLTTSGSGHVKFWKMSRTFTGQKLKGDLGRFGKTDISDVIAVYPMPDETVVSGCEWGNILLWDVGLIKLEVCKKNMEAVHDNCISQFEYVNGELISIGMDGWVKFWFFETIDQADLPDTERYLEILPICEYQIIEENAHPKESSMLMSIRKENFDDPECTLWYAQDGNGGIWQVDLCTISKPQPPRKIFTCHAGPIVDMDVALWGPYTSTFDKSGQLNIYNYQRKTLIVVHKFFDEGCRVIWLPPEVESTGSTLICSFASGLIRMIAVDIQRADDSDNLKGDYVRMIRILKPHTMPINLMTLNPQNKFLVTGSEDCTIFTFKIESTETYPDILPIGYIKIPSPATCASWKPSEDDTLLIGCLKGDIVEAVLKGEPLEEPITTYKRNDMKYGKIKFQSMRSSIEREAVRQEQLRQREGRLAKRREEMEKLKAENPHIVLDEESFLADFYEDPPLPEIYIPEVPNRVLIADYKLDGTIWILMSGFDAGYIYEYKSPLSSRNEQAGLLKTKPIVDARNTEIRTHLYYKNRSFLLLSTEHGEIRVCRLNSADETYFSDYWLLPIHDYYNGHISKMMLSFDRKQLITCGHDGNLFAFNIKDDLPEEVFDIPETWGELTLPAKSVEDIEDVDYPSIEQVVTKIEMDRVMAEAKKKKEQTLQTIFDLVDEYDMITTRNQSLTPSQRIQEFHLDPRITKDLDLLLNEQMALTRRKLEFKVEKSELELKKLMDRFINPITCLPFAVRGILNTEKIVYSLRQRKLEADSLYADTGTSKTTLEKAVTEEELLHQAIDPQVLVDPISLDEHTHSHLTEEVTEEADPIENLLKSGFGKIPSGLEMQIYQMTAKYREQKAKMKQRKQEWDAMHAIKPDLSKREKEDEELLEKTRQTIGKYNLKQSETPESIKLHQTTAMAKYMVLSQCRMKLFSLRENFNTRLREVRSKKQALQKEVLRLIDTLKRIHAEIPAKNVKPLPDVPEIDQELEFPEHNLELEQYISRAQRMMEVKKLRQSLVEEQHFDPKDKEYEILLLDETARKAGDDETLESLSLLVSSSMSKLTLLTIGQVDVVKGLTARDHIETAYEREMKSARIKRKIFEQDCILSHIQSSYEKLDGQLCDLEEYRLQVVAESVYMELFILTLFEEFVVLKESEASENVLQQKVDDKAKECASLQLTIRGTHDKISIKEDEVKRLLLKIKDLAYRFNVAISDNKFHDYLYKIYKKKYSAKKEESTDITTISSDTSSESSESDSDSDIDQVFDESVCPQGCDQNLYQLAFTMRESRYECERQIREEQKEIEALKKEVETDGKLSKLAESQLKNNSKELEAFRIEKQKKLNNIDVTVVLKFHQVKHLISADNPILIKDCLVFDKQRLSDLYARVGVLQDETIALQETLKSNQTHLNRIKQDCKYMTSENKKLEEEINEESIRKFGQKIPVLSLYEAVLRRLVYDAKTDLHDVSTEYNQQIKEIKCEYEKALMTLEGLLRENTEKLSILTVLEKEKAKLEKILKRTPTSEEEMAQIESEHRRDLAKLESILESQHEQKLQLQNDIMGLQSGKKRLPPLCTGKNPL